MKRTLVYKFVVNPIYDIYEYNVRMLMSSQYTLFRLSCAISLIYNWLHWYLFLCCRFTFTLTEHVFNIHNCHT